MRLLTTANRNAINADRVNLTWLVRITLPLPVGNIYLCSGVHTQHWAGVDWLGAGDLLDMEFPEESASLEAKNGELVLSGLDPALISLALNTDLEGAVVHTWALLRDPDTNQPVDAPFVVHRGTISEIRISQPFAEEAAS
jgi:hypothetical protein